MREALDLLDLAADAVAMHDPHALTVDDLRDGVIGLQRHIDRVKGIHARLVAAGDSVGVWRGGGKRNLADWLSSLTGTAYGDAASRVRLGEALGASPELADAVDAGEVSAATAEVVHDAVTNPVPDGDVGELVEAVKGAGPRDAREAAEKFREVHTKETPEQAEQRRRSKRSVRSGPAIDGLVTTTVVLPELESREFHQVVSFIGGKPSEGDGRTTEQRLADGLIRLCKAYAAGTVGGGREKPTIVITIDADSFVGAANEPGVTAHGDRIPAHIVRRLAEQATLQRLIHDGNTILELGREVRYATDSQFKALLVRDGGCRWAGCHIPAAWCQADHLLAWEDGGLTDLNNLVLWCSHHHHEKHRPGVQVLGDVHDLRLRLANGTIIDCPTRGHTRTRTRTRT
ncbi:MAG: DUF222 domain-containing protein, partial [Actinomycetota bacterium]|nr:DUF222 domain-containing protein [Actinomycetota bacterium]